MALSALSRRKLTITAGTAAGAWLMAACGAPSGTAGTKSTAPATVTFHWIGASEQEMVEKRTPVFMQEHPNIKVNLEPYGGDDKLMTLATSGATPEDSGLASGLVNTTQQVGGALGLAVLATLSTDRTESLVASGSGQADALTGGFHLAFGVGAALVIFGLLLAVTLLRPAAEPAVATVTDDERVPVGAEPAWMDEAA